MRTHASGRILALAVIALGCLAAQADMEIGGIVLKEGPQDLVQVSQSEWAWGGGAEKYPCVSVSFQSGRFAYTIRHDRKYDNGQIGISEPTTVNWYQSGMLSLFINGERYPLLPENGETLELTSGRRGTAVFSWENAQAKVRYSFALFAGQDRLLMQIALEPKVEITDLRLRLTCYPSGTNRAPKHVLQTSGETLDRHGAHDLAPGRASALIYLDEALDVANNPGAAGPCALAFDPAPVKALKVATGGYGIGTDLVLQPEARRVSLCFWEFPARSNAEALELFRSGAPEALKSLADPATFAR